MDHTLIDYALNYSLPENKLYPKLPDTTLTYLHGICSIFDHIIIPMEDLNTLIKYISSKFENPLRDYILSEYAKQNKKEELTLDSAKSLFYIAIITYILYTSLNLLGRGPKVLLTIWDIKFALIVDQSLKLLFANNNNKTLFELSISEEYSGEVNKNIFLGIITAVNMINYPHELKIFDQIVTNENLYQHGFKEFLSDDTYLKQKNSFIITMINGESYYVDENIEIPKEGQRINVCENNNFLRGFKLICVMMNLDYKKYISEIKLRKPNGEIIRFSIMN